MEITADQDQGQDYKTLQDQDQNRSRVEPLPSECMLYEIMWQTTASSSIKLCESDKHLSLSPHGTIEGLRLLMLTRS